MFCCAVGGLDLNYSDLGASLLGMVETKGTTGLICDLTDFSISEDLKREKLSAVAFLTVLTTKKENCDFSVIFFIFVSGNQ